MLKIASLLSGIACFVAPALAQDTFVNAAVMEAAASGRGGGILLGDGRVVFWSGSQPTSGIEKSNLEIYNPVNNQFTVTGNTLQLRGSAGVAKLVDGRIYFGGGFASNGNGNLTAEIFDPATNSFTRVADLPSARGRAPAVTLPDGRVIMFGGVAYSTWDFNQVIQNACIYDPATNTYSTIGMPIRWELMSVTLLANGKVLLSGGRVGANQWSSATLYLFDPATNGFTLLSNMSVARVDHGVALLPNGKVLLVGGNTAASGTSLTAACDIFDTATNTVTSTVQMAVARQWPRVATLNDGRILISSEQSPLAEIFNPATTTFSTPSGQPGVTRRGGAAIKLTDGRVLVAGGNIPYPAAAAVQAELYTWANNQPPVANAGSDIIAYVGAGTSGSVTLNGSSSSDPEGGALTYTWTGTFGSAQGATPAVTLPVGVHHITLTVKDPLNSTATATVHVAVVQGTDLAGYTQLQAQVVDLNSQLTAANAQITTLTNQNTALTAANLVLTQKNASLTTLLQSLLTAFDQIKGYANSIITVSDEKKQAINQALGN